MSTPEWTVGQEVILREHRHRSTQDKPVTIARVARKYVYIDNGWRQRAFYKDTGYEKVEGVYGGRLFTEESLAENDRRDAATTRVLELVRNYSWTRPLSTEALEQIADLIESGQDR